MRFWSAVTTSLLVGALALPVSATDIGEQIAQPATVSPCTKNAARGATVTKPSTTLTRSQATMLARDYLAKSGLVILDESIVERDFGWVFLSDSEAFARTRDPNKSVPGVGPLVVHRTGEICLLPSAPPDAAIDAYEKAWRNR